MWITPVAHRSVRLAIVAVAVAVAATTLVSAQEQAATYEIIARHSGQAQRKAMDVEFASTDDGARVIQYSPHDGANQQWLLRPAP